MTGPPASRFIVTALAWSVLWATASGQPSAPATTRPRVEGDYRVARWTTAEGLPQNTVNDIVLLPNGELWLATFGGLARFDGHRFHVVDIATDEGLPANRVTSLAPAGNDSFWFLTQQGHLGRVDGGRATTLVQPASPSIDAPRSLCGPCRPRVLQLVDGSIWHTSGAHAWRLVLGSSDSGGMLHAFATTEAGEVWAGWGTQLVRLRDGAALQSAKVPSLDPDLFPRAGGGLWLGLRDGLARFDDGKVESRRRPAGHRRAGHGGRTRRRRGALGRNPRQRVSPGAGGRRVMAANPGLARTSGRNLRFVR